MVRALRSLAALAIFVLSCTPAESPPGEASRAETVRIGILRPPASLDPHRYSDTISWQVGENLFEGLVGLDEHGRLRPALAASWAHLDDRTLELKLRQGVHFHDGAEMSIDDVLASLERTETDTESVMHGAIAHVEVEASADGSTIRLITEEQDPLLLYRLLALPILPRGSVEGAPVGTGPYRWVAPPEGVEVAIERFADYWGPAPKIRRAEFLVEPSIAEGRNRLLAGDLDLTMLRLPEVASVEQDPTCEVVPVLAGAVFFLTLPANEPPWSDPRVREALDLAIDRVAYVTEADGTRRGSPASQMVSPDTFGFDPSIATPTFDPERARTLLAEAGLSEVVVEVAHIDRQPIDRLIDAVADGVGFRLVSRPLPVEDFRRLSPTGELGVFWSAVVPSTGDAAGTLEQRAHSPTSDLRYGRSNVAGWSDPELDEIVEAASTTHDPETRLQLLQAAMRRFTAGHAYLPVHYPYVFFGVGSRFVWTSRADKALPLVDARPAD